MMAVTMGVTVIVQKQLKICMSDWSVRAMTIEEAREEFMAVVYDELSNDSDNCRANRIIDAADEYVEEVMKLGRENK
jgi:hypothetical protein